jgi:regulatory protein
VEDEHSTPGAVRAKALDVALRALGARDHSAASLDARLQRRGIAAADRSVAVARLVELGYVDDVRFALGRAETVAGRGAGDLLVAHDLERQGIDAALVARAVESLEPELDRARAIVARRGATAKTARLLVTRGFAPETVEEAIAGVAEEAVG